MFKELHYEKHRLNNGLTLLLKQNGHLPLVSVCFFSPVGKAQNPMNQPGLSALTARLLDEGTASFTSSQISALVENSGSELTTFSDQEITAIVFQLRSADLGIATELIAEMVRYPTFPEDRFLIEQRKILDHIASMQDDPQIVGSQILNEQIYEGTALAHPVLGTSESVSALTPADLRRFCETHYSPRNSILAIVGDFDLSEAHRLIEENFFDWQNPHALPAQQFTFTPPSESVIVRHPMPKEQVNIFVGHLGTVRKNPDHYPLQVMDVILGGGPGFTARIPRVLRDEQGLAYVTYSDIAASSGLYPGRFAAYIGTSPCNWEKALKGLEAEILKLVDDGVREEELEVARDFLTGSFVFEYQSNSAVARLLMYCELFDLGEVYARQYFDYIQSVSCEDVLRVARRYLDTVNYTTVLVGSM